MMALGIAVAMCLQTSTMTIGPFSYQTTQYRKQRRNGGPGSSATADEIFFYNANAGATGYPQDEPFYDNLATQGITYAPPSNVNTNFTFSHTAQVTGTLDSNGDLEFWVGGETTQTSEIATIEGISNVQLTGPQLPGEVLIKLKT